MVVATVLLGGFGGTAALLSWTAPTVLSAWSAVHRPDETPERLVEHAVVVLAAAALTALLLWLSLSLLVCTVDALRTGGAPAPRSPLRPRLVQALVAATLGTLVTAGSAGVVGAHAPRDAEVPRALHGLTVPDRSYGVVRSHLVRPGESLWSITTEHLRGDAPAWAVAHRWPRLHRLNRDRIGGDPHLIHPGTPLRLPTWGAAPTRGATR